jgi:cell division protein FtsQ
VQGVAAEVLAILRGIGGAVARVLPGSVRERGSRGGTAARERVARTVVVSDRARRSREQRAPRSAAQERVAAERRTRLRGHLRIAAVVALALAVLGAWLVVPASDAFRIRHVEVTGAAAVDDLQVRMRIDELLEGETVFTVDEAAVERRIEELPFVRDARVERHLPGGLQLHVSEYRPLALAYGDGEYWLVAQDGRILAEADGRAWRGRIPTVELRGRDIAPGDRVGDEPALQLLAELPESSTVQFDTIRTDDYQLEATLVDGTEVRFGRPEQLLLKAVVLDRVLELAARAGDELKYVDVSVPGVPAWCAKDVTACHLPRGPVEQDEAAVAEASAATTPEETGGDEAADPDAGA